MDTQEKTRAAILAHFQKHGRMPNYASVGGYYVAEPVINAMIADGTLVWVTVTSPKGRKMNHLRPKGWQS